jgi:ABC-2 type transport system permease protein
VAGAVYDRGYRPYEGERGGRREARAALFRATARRALGWRRPWRQKVVPFALLAIVTVPAIVNVGIAYVSQDTVGSDIEFFTYRDYVGVSNALLVFVALTAPDIMCPDRRQRVLPLIFARPLKGVDYVIAKVGAMTAILFAFSFLPQVLLFVGQMLVSDDGALTYLRENAEVLWQVPVAVALLSLYYAAIGVAISSLTSRRIIAGALIVGLFLVTSVISEVLVEAEEVTVQRGSGLPSQVIIDEDGERQVVIIGEDGQERPIIVDDETGEAFVRREPTAAPLLNVAGLPLLLRDVVFLGQIEDTHPMGGLDNGGVLAGLVYVFIVGVSLTTLFVRYDEVER